MQVHDNETRRILTPVKMAQPSIRTLRILRLNMAAKQLQIAHTDRYCNYIPIVIIHRLLSTT